MHILFYADLRYVLKTKGVCCSWSVLKANLYPVLLSVCSGVGGGLVRMDLLMVRSGQMTDCFMFISI